MSDEDRPPGREKASSWKLFSTHYDAESGVQLTIDKGGCTYSPRIRFEHKKNGTFSSYGRVTPDFKENLDEFHPLRAIVDGLLRIIDEAEPALRAEAKKDQEAFLKRRDRSSSAKKKIPTKR